MPTYLVTDSQTGRQLRLTGDTPPTDSELESIFAQQGGQDGISTGRGAGAGAAVDSTQATQLVDGQIGRPAGRVDTGIPDQEGFPGAAIIEPAAALVSGAIAEPIAGIAGAVTGILPGEEGAAAQAVEATREALTFQPRTEEGKAGLQAVAETLEPAVDALKGAETFLGDETFAATGSPALAASATTIPTVMLEVLGVAGVKGAIKVKSGIKKASRDRQVRKATVKAAPEIDQIKDASRAVYKELEDSGMTIKAKPLENLSIRINSEFNKAGFFRDVAPGLAPKADAVAKTIESIKGKSLTLPEMDALRSTAQLAAKSIDPTESRLGGIAIDTIDDFMDDLTKEAFSSGTLKPSEILPKYGVARELWGRARRSEIIADAFDKAELQASGFENGVVSQFRGIINNKKKSRYFKKAELDSMRDVVKGGGLRDIAKAIGRLGFSEGHSTNVLGGLSGIVTGKLVGGLTGAAVVPIIGQTSRALAQRLTRGKGQFADAVIRAGDDASKIVSIYLKNTPKGKRLSSELSELLLRPDVALDAALDSSNVLLREAAEIAKGTRTLKAVAATAAGAGAIKEQ